MGVIRVGFTEKHGMYAEQALFPPQGVEFKELNCIRNGSSIFRSPIKGFMSQYNTLDVDLIESVISPLITKRPWTCSLAVYQEALAFDLFGFPTPLTFKRAIINHLFQKDNCKNILFWSYAGLKTMNSYGKVNSKNILEKCCVVYPAVRKIEGSKRIPTKNEVNILFSGDFFRKGGVNVVDTFEELQKKQHNINLRLCCDLDIDFYTKNTHLKKHYIQKIKSNPKIIIGRVPRDEMIRRVLPQTDIYLLPTYQEAFGFSVLEAMSFGIPVITTNYMAMPEIVEDKQTGFLIDIAEYDVDKMFKGYVVNEIPQVFRDCVTNQLIEKLSLLISDVKLRKDMGVKARLLAQTKFSFDERNKQILKIYSSALHN